MTESWWRLQGGAPDEERLLRDYAALLEAYFDQRDLVPRGRLCEVAYADLVREPRAAVERIYAALGLSVPDDLPPTLERYLAAIAGYRPNRYPALTDAERWRVRRHWWRAFLEWGYGEQESGDAARPHLAAATVESRRPMA